MENKRTYFITGTAGFIGGWLAETLALKGSVRVLAGVRKWNVARIARFPVEMVLCDIMNRNQISKAMSDATTVVHCAVGDKETIIEGTNNLLQIALEKGIQSFVYISSAVVYGDVTGEIDENFPTQYTGNEYTDSKIRAEQLCREYYEKGVPITVLRPSIIYGPFSNGWTTRIAEKLQSGNCGLYDEFGEGICNLVYVKDLISSIILAANNDKAVGEAFNINGPEIITWNHYFQTFNTALNLPGLKRISSSKAKVQSATRDRINYFSSYFKSHFGDAIRDLNRRSRLAEYFIHQLKEILNTYPSNYELNKLYSRNTIYSSTKIRDVLGFVPSYDLSMGLEESVLWLKQYGFMR